MITSLGNAKIKHARALQQRKAREQHQQFLIEGVHLLQEAQQAGMQPAFVFCAPQFARSADGQGIAQWWPQVFEVVSESVLASVSDTVTPQGIVAIVPYPLLHASTSDLVLVMDKLRDPGNVGTLLRSAWAAGVSEVLVSVGSADVYSPKVVRAAMGAHFRLPMQHDVDWSAIAAHVNNLPVLLADANGELSYDAWDWRQPSALIISNEAEGASTEARALATQRVHVPMEASTESLNAAVAGSVILFEAARQRRKKEHG
jgi:TrmH family RNA methyltransferase